MRKLSAEVPRPRDKDAFYFLTVYVICTNKQKRCSRLCNPLLASLPELQYFTAFVSAIDSAVNPTPHPWKGFRILIPLPSPVHLNLNAFRKQDFMHDLPPPSLLPSSLHPLHPSPLFPLPPSLLGLLSSSPPKRICVEMASALVGSENVQCTIVAMEQAGRQAGSSPSLSGLFTQFSSFRRILCAHSFEGFVKLSTQPGGDGKYR